MAPRTEAGGVTRDRIGYAWLAAGLLAHGGGGLLFLAGVFASGMVGGGSPSGNVLPWLGGSVVLFAVGGYCTFRGWAALQTDDGSPFSATGGQGPR